MEGLHDYTQYSHVYFSTWLNVSRLNREANKTAQRAAMHA